MIKKIWQKYQDYKNKKENLNTANQVFKPSSNNPTPEQNLLMHIFSNKTIPMSKEESYPSQTREVLKEIFDQNKRLIDLSKDSPLYNKIMLEFGENGSPQEQSRICAKLRELISFLPLDSHETEVELRTEMESILHNSNIPVKKKIQLLDQLFISVNESVGQNYISL